MTPPVWQLDVSDSDVRPEHIFIHHLSLGVLILTLGPREDPNETHGLA